MFDTDKYVLVVCVSCAVECAGLWSDTILTNSVQSSVQLSTITEFSDPEYQYLDQDKNANTSLPFSISVDNCSFVLDPIQYRMLLVTWGLSNSK